MNYTLHQLRVFVCIADFQSITKAAEHLYLTQPAVSIQLKKLQDQFEIPLTEVIGRQLHITEFGKEIVEVSRRVLAEADTIGALTDRFKGLLTGKIKISVVSTGKYVMPYFMSEFVRNHAKVEIVMDVTNKKEVVQSLVSNQTDFALVSVLPAGVDLIAEELMENRLYFVGKSLEHRTSFDKKKLDSLPLIFRETGSATRAAMEDYLKRQDIHPQKTMELQSNEAVKQALNAGLGYSIMPLIGLRNSLYHGDLEIHPVKGLPIITSWNLVYLKGKNLSPAGEAFLDHIRSSKEQIIDQHFSWVEEFIRTNNQ